MQGNIAIVYFFMQLFWNDQKWLLHVHFILLGHGNHQQLDFRAFVWMITWGYSVPKSSLMTHESCNNNITMPVPKRVHLGLFWSAVLWTTWKLVGSITTGWKCNYIGKTSCMEIQILLDYCKIEHHILIHVHVYKKNHLEFR